MSKRGSTELFQSYLDWNETEVRARVQNAVFCSKSKFVVPILDLPVLKDDTEYRRFFIQANKAGFRKFNLGLTSVWNKKLPRYFFETAKKIGINFASAHGTSLKYSLKYGTPYKKVLSNDRQSLGLLGKNKVAVNYDLFAGHLPELCFTDNFKKTSAKNIIDIADKIFVENSIRATEKSITDYIISSLAEVFVVGDERRCLTLEIPGTKGWSMLPSPVFLQTDNLLDSVETFLPGAAITIDLAHLLTWGKDKNSLIKAKQIIDKYQYKIRMLHICSAGTDNKFFSSLYKNVYKNKYPQWHINSLDASLFIYETEMIELISYIRKKIKHSLLEVTESRLPSLTVKDYFSTSGIKANDEWFYRLLKYHSKILRYV